MSLNYPAIKCQCFLVVDPGPSLVSKRRFPDSKNTIMHSSLTQVMHEAPPSPQSLPPTWLSGPINPVSEWTKRNGG